MFDTELTDGYSFPSWLVQQIAAVAVPAIVGLLTSGLAEHIEERRGYPLSVIANVLWYTFFVWGIGFYLGLLVYRLAPRAATVGRWVWVLPVGFFCFAFLDDTFRHSLGYAITEFFNPGPNGEAWWALMGITYPACSAALYSLGMCLASRRARQRTAAHRSLRSQV